MEASNRAGLKGDTDWRERHFVGTITHTWYRWENQQEKTDDTEKREDKCRNKFPEQAWRGTVKSTKEVTILRLKRGSLLLVTEGKAESLEHLKILNRSIDSVMNNTDFFLHVFYLLNKK